MSSISDIVRETGPAHEAAGKQLELLLNTARVESVFGAPVTQGEFTAIVAAEVTAIVGFGFGSGGGEAQIPPGTDAGGVDAAGEPLKASSSSGAGGGGGGGGTVLGKPVAVIEIGPVGVRVQPIVDPTKIVLAFLTTFGAMFVALSRVRGLADKLGE